MGRAEKAERKRRVGIAKGKNEGRDKLKSDQSNQNSGRRVLRGRAVKRVKTSGVGEETKRRLRRTRVAEEVGEGGAFESEGGEEGSVL